MSVHLQPASPLTSTLGSPMFAYAKIAALFGCGAYFAVSALRFILPDIMFVMTMQLTTTLVLVAALTSIFVVPLFRNKSKSTAIAAGMIIVIITSFLSPLIWYATTLRTTENLIGMLVWGVLGISLCGVITLPTGAILGLLAHKLVYEKRT